MNAFFADTSFYISAISPRDELHAQAVSLIGTLQCNVITTEYVLVELGSYFSRALGRSAFVELVRRIEIDPQTEIVWVTDELFREGFDLFSRRPDKDWSLTDCISFVVMNDRNLTKALTSDHHFSQAGFEALLERP